MHEGQAFVWDHVRGGAIGMRGGAVSHISFTSAGVRPNAAFTISDTRRSRMSAFGAIDQGGQGGGEAAE